MISSCLVCNEKLINCDCKDAWLSFFRILQVTTDRVSSYQSTSTDSEKGSSGSAKIDKLEFTLQKPIQQAELISKLESLGIKSKTQRLRGAGWHIVFGPEDSIQVKLSFQSVERFSTRPCAFDNWKEYRNYMSAIIGEQFMSAKPKRFDLTVDYETDFSTLMESVDVRYKQCDVNYESKNGETTGIRIGKKPEVISIYDKSLRSNLPCPTSRIEVVLTGKKIDFDTIKDFTSAAQKPEGLKDIIKALDKIELFDLSFVEQIKDSAKSIRLNELRLLIKHNGFFGAKRSLNTQDNFTRDFACLFQKNIWSNQPIDITKHDLPNFFNTRSTNE